MFIALKSIILGAFLGGIKVTDQGKLALNVKELEFENDFGQNPVGLGHFSKDQGFIAVASLVGAFVGAAVAGLPLAALVLIAGLNDIRFASRRERQPSEAVVAAASEAVVADDSEAVVAAATPSTKNELLQALRQQCPSLLSLVKSHPIRCVGVQRAGKTTLVKKLALLRMVLLPDHKVIASTPHHEPTNSYPAVFQIAGIRNGKRDYPAIQKEWHGLAQRVESGTVSSTTTIWDEFGLMDKVLDENSLTSMLTSCLRETMKFGEYPIFIIHGETQAFLPGSKGLVTALLSSTVRLEAIGEKVIGADGLEDIQPTGKFKIQWLDGTRSEGQIPQWLTEDLLTGMLPAPQQHPAVERSEKSLPDAEPDKIEHLNALLDGTFSRSELPERSASEPLNLDPFSAEITLQERGAVVSFRRSGQSKEETIFLVWGARKGGSKAYVRAKEKLDFILSKSGLD